ncbi:eukaryotic translation initiation factor 3 subunit A-like isoform X2 [Anneissia japonica]|uniref:eukaryotic translation initiation factor 3 subunit A-like isoform X2 n=1 Tax=Anneissia japonica TaxID=1529436 RepID=UPI00142583B9|nr:eukaryotic translation initiation factor 3 subunit A-like isoform X2 [Anneissia japonica]
MDLCINLQEDVRKKIHPPSKKLYDQQIEGLVQKISTLETKLKSLKTQSSDNLSPTGTLERDSHFLKTLREDKENKIKERKKIEEELKVISNTISIKKDVLSKKQARLPAKSVDKLESMIKRLEYQLEHTHFNLREETRMVKEIDSHKRSMKHLRECLGEKEELDIEVAKKNRLRAQRDKLFKEISGLRSEEDKVRRQLKEVRSQASIEWSNLKKEIDDLYNQKRRITATYQAEYRQFHERRAMYREQNERQKVMQREAKERELKQKMKEHIPDPYAYKQRQINTLMTYLQRHSYTQDASSHNASLGQDRSSSLLQSIQDGASASHIPAGTSLSSSSSFNEDRGHVLQRKKNEEDEWMFAGNLSRNKKKRNRKTSWMNKVISHPPDIFPLFSELGLTAPSSVGDVAEVVSQLQKAKLHYEQCSKRQRSDTGNTGIDSGTASSSECYSPSVTDIIPNFKAHGKKSKTDVTGDTLLNDEDDENDSVFDEPADDEDPFQLGGSCIPPSVKPRDEKPILKLKIGTTNHSFESSMSLPKQNQGQSLIEDNGAVVTYQNISSNSEELTPLPDVKVPDLMTSLSSLSMSDICESEQMNIEKIEPVVSDVQELHVVGEGSL